MANEPKIQEPDIPAKQPDINPEPKPQESRKTRMFRSKTRRRGDFRSRSLLPAKKEPLSGAAQFLAEKRY